jgi:hypothetical protein
VFLVPDPPALGDQPFPSGHRGQRPDDRGLVPVSRCFDAQDTEATLVVVESDALDDPGNFLGRGPAWVFAGPIRKPILRGFGPEVGWVGLGVSFAQEGFGAMLMGMSGRKPDPTRVIFRAQMNGAADTQHESMRESVEPSGVEDAVGSACSRTANKQCFL